jgi:hypothetical protein
MENPSRRSVRYRIVSLGSLALVAAAAGLAAQPGLRPAEDMERLTAQRSSYARTPEKIIEGWPERARGAALAMMEKYGPPNRVSGEALVWYNNGPWQKTIVYRRSRPHSPATRGQDFLEQVIGYQVPNDRINALKRFSERIAVNKAKGELSFRSESESMNFLALNLADEIITGKRSAEDARLFYRDTARLSQSGKTSPYVEGFRFEMFGDKSSSPEYPGFLSP